MESFRFLPTGFREIRRTPLLLMLLVSTVFACPSAEAGFIEVKGWSLGMKLADFGKTMALTCSNTGRRTKACVARGSYAGSPAEYGAWFEDDRLIGLEVVASDVSGGIRKSLEDKYGRPNNVDRADSWREWITGDEHLEVFLPRRRGPMRLFLRSSFDLDSWRETRKTYSEHDM